MLFGYVRTKLKIGAPNILAVPPEYDPLLASWDCGEGRARGVYVRRERQMGRAVASRMGPQFRHVLERRRAERRAPLADHEAGSAPERQRPVACAPASICSI